MELTPQQLCEVEFSEQWRGYSRDQVDDFIERVAAAVNDLQTRLRTMTERAVRAEQRAQESVEADGAARRTLVLAQRTADATVAEAKETAARLVAQSQEEARAIMLAAEASVTETGSPGEPRARAEIADLEVTRSRLHADVAALEAQLTDRRTRIKDLLDELQRRVDEGLEGHIAQWPSFDEGRLLADSHDTQDMHPAHDTPGPTTFTAPEAAGQADVASDIELAPAPEIAPDAPARELVSDAAQAREDLAVPDPWDDTVRSPDHALDDDAFFAQLRGALDDDAPLGPRENTEPAAGLLRWGAERATAVAEAPRLYDQEQPEGRRFGLRRRRQRRRD